MTNAELKDALLDKRTVRYDDINYVVNGIIYRSYDGKSIVLTAELLDRNGDCVVIAPISRIQEAT